MMEARRSFFPYGMQKFPDGGWMLFGRDYKPLGLHTAERVDYSATPNRFYPRRAFSKATLARLDFEGVGELNGNKLFFYNDGCIPTRSAAAMKAYLDRLTLLMFIKIQPPGFKPRRKVPEESDPYGIL